MKRPLDFDLPSCDPALLGRIADRAVQDGDVDTIMTVSNFAITIALTSSDTVERLTADGIVDWLQRYIPSEGP